MPFLAIRHITTYRYRRPVAFGEHIPALVAALKDSDARVRQQRRCGAGADRAGRRRGHTRARRRPQGQRCRCPRARRWGAVADRAGCRGYAALTAALEDPDPDVRRWAARVLGKMGRPPPRPSQHSSPSSRTATQRSGIAPLRHWRRSGRPPLRPSRHSSRLLRTPTQRSCGAPLRRWHQCRAGAARFSVLRHHAARRTCRLAARSGRSEGASQVGVAPTCGAALSSSVSVGPIR